MGSVRPNPKKFLKRGYYKALSQSVQFKTLKKLKPFSIPKLVRFPGVPKSTERPIHGLNSNKNYIITNAIDNILKGN